MALIGALLAGVLFASIGPAVQGTTSQPVPRDAGGARGQISGVVVDAQGPVPGATVELEDPNRRRLTVAADGAGRFTFSALQPNSYVVIASTEEHLPGQFGAVRSGGPGTPIVLAANERVTDLVVTMARGGSIAGSVRTADGMPAPNVDIAVTQIGDHPIILRSVTTDQAGAYRFAGLRAGSYQLAARERGKPYPPVFYPAGIDPSRAQPVDVADGRERDGIDLTLVAGTTTRIIGVARSANQLPIQQLRLNLIEPFWPDGVFRERPVPPEVKLGPDGTFTVIHVVPGRHTIRATARSATDDELRGEVTIDVPESGVMGVTVDLAPPRRVSGRLVFTGTRLRTPDLSKIYIFLDALGRPSTEPVFAQADGSFDGPASPGLPGISPVLGDGADRGWFLRSAMWNGRDLLDLPPELENSIDDLTGVVLTFQDRPTRLEGKVTAADGTPMTACSVVVFPADRQLWSSIYRRLRSRRPDSKGLFAFENLPPGDYLVTTVADLDPQWKVPAFLETLVAASLRLTLGEGEQITRDLRR